MKKLDSNHPERADENWKGYTLEELMYQRAYNTARLEIQKQRILSNYHHLGKGGGEGKTSFIGRLMSGISYLDLGIAAYKIGSRVFKSFRRLRR